MRFELKDAECDLLALADKEPMLSKFRDKRQNRIYRLGPVIHKLREKNWSWTRIAEWLKRRTESVSRAMIYKDYQEWKRSAPHAKESKR